MLFVPSMWPTKLDYTNEEFHAVIAPLARAFATSPPDAELLRTRLINLLASAGVILENEFDAVLHELIGFEPSESILANVYKRLQGRSVIPLRRASADIGRSVATTLSAELRNQVRVRGLDHLSIMARYDATRRVLQITGFEDRIDLQIEICAELGLYHQKCIRQGRAQNSKLDTMMLGLADCFVDATGFKFHRMDLPHGNRSHFIRFASASLAPFIKNTEIESTALGKRWNRLKKHHSSGL